jgi:sulfur-carrier protein adenylyltransferase/sulfurtransferase
MPPIPEITVEDLKALTDRGADFTLLDVREPFELNICYLPDAASIPMNQIPNRLNELDPDKDLVVFCKVGGRSARVVAYLQQQGFSRAVNLRGGILEWIDKIDPTQAKY